MTNATPSSRCHARARRGVVMAVIVLMLASINAITMTVLYSSGDEATLGALRVETARALYAAESASIAVVRLRSERRPLPIAGSSLALPTGNATYVQVPGDNTPTGTLVVRGQSGDAERRVRLDFVVR
jgi:Tfp pilus assembly protein PilX